MKEFLNKVREFQVASEQLVNDKPTNCNYIETELRHGLMLEENDEYFDATDAGSLIGTLDAVVDMAYVLFGTINAHGLQDLFVEAFNLVHENNMTKCVDGKVIRNEFGKILKPENFVPVDLKQLFNK